MKRGGLTMKRILCAAAVALVLGAGSQPARAITQEAKLTDASLPALARSGAAVAISGTTAVVGAPQEGGGVGAVYVYIKTGATWGFQAKLVADEDSGLAGIQPGIPGDVFGTSVSIHGNEIAVGAPGRGGHGAAYTFSRTGTTWTQDPQILTGAGSAAGDLFGQSVWIETTTLAVGAPKEAVGTKAEQGVVYAYVRGRWPVTLDDRREFRRCAHHRATRQRAGAGPHWLVGLAVRQHDHRRCSRRRSGQQAEQGLGSRLRT
jgi:hypothetical protein